jgi:hypothetical protein
VTDTLSANEPRSSGGKTVALAEQAIGAIFIEDNGCRAEATERQYGNVRFNDTRYDISSRSLRSDNQVNAGGARHLGIRASRSPHPPALSASSRLARDDDHDIRHPIGNDWFIISRHVDHGGRRFGSLVLCRRHAHFNISINSFCVFFGGVR